MKRSGQLGMLAILAQITLLAVAKLEEDMLEAGIYTNSLEDAKEALSANAEVLDQMAQAEYNIEQAEAKAAEAKAAEAKTAEKSESETKPTRFFVT